MPKRNSFICSEKAIDIEKKNVLLKFGKNVIDINLNNNNIIIWFWNKNQCG